MAMETETNSIPAIEFRDVSLGFDEKQVLTDINFKLERGEMIFITGASGSGKSVLMKLAIALERPDSGQILIEGRDVAQLDETELLELRGNRIGIVFQEDSLFTGLTVYDNVAYRLDEHNVPEDEARQAVMEVLQFVRLEQDAEKLRLLGCRPEALQVVGSLKFDAAPLDEKRRLNVPALLAQLGVPPTARILVGGSTHKGEDGILAEQFLRLRSRFPDSKLIVGQWGSRTDNSNGLIDAGADKIGNKILETRDHIIQLSQILPP